VSWAGSETTPCSSLVTPGGCGSPWGKLHNDRNIPLHPLLVGLINDYEGVEGAVGERVPARTRRRQTVRSAHSVASQVPAATPLGGCWPKGLAPDPVELDCRFQNICEGCGFYQPSVEFIDILRRQRNDAIARADAARAELYDQLVAVIDATA
jgi:hypothetical protein